MMTLVEQYGNVTIGALVQLTWLGVVLVLTCLAGYEQLVSPKSLRRRKGDRRG